jgi:hypothetical protein
MCQQSERRRVSIQRLPFARGDVVRESVTVTAGRSCDWCGQAGRFGRLFSYGFSSDGGRESMADGLFCSRSCSRSYHGE